MFASAAMILVIDLRKLPCPRSVPATYIGSAFEAAFLIPWSPRFSRCVCQVPPTAVAAAKFACIAWRAAIAALTIGLVVPWNCFSQVGPALCVLVFHREA